MKLAEFANRFVTLYAANDHSTIYSELYSPDVVSIEADGQVVEGMAGVEAKNKWWEETFEFHGGSHEGPFPHGEDTFCMIYDMDVTHRPSGHRNQSREVAVYEVKDGRIVRERFCYTSEGG